MREINALVSAGAVAAGLLFSTASPAQDAATDSAATNPPAPAGTPAASLASRWGGLGAPDSANTATFSGRPQPAWEKIVNFPYNVVFLPVKLLGIGIEASVQAFDEKPVLRRILRAFPLRAGSALFSGGVTAGGGDGFGGNVSIDIPDFGARHHAMKLRLAGRTRGERRATLALRFRRNDVSWFDLGGGYRSDHNARFYGIGPSAPESAESFHRRETTWAGVTWTRQLADFGSSLTGLYSSAVATGTDHSDDPHLSERFVGALPFGYRDRSEGLGVGWTISHENTERMGPPGAWWRERNRPERGGLRRVGASWFQGKGNSRAEFWTWRAEAQQFLPLPLSRRVLALRGLISRIENEGDDPVPFQRLLTNDDPDLLRGYPDGRFRDVGLLAATAEYRWPLWALNRENGIGADAFVFADFGQVFSEMDQIAAKALTESYGGGVRVGGHGRFTGRIELGWSEEGMQFRLRADQTFQFERGGFFFGRSPVPDR
jgi:hypothetical protein